jgi:hypothetical protein
MVETASIGDILNEDIEGVVILREGENLTRSLSGNGRRSVLK